MIDSRQLRYFAAVAEHLHFGHAADTLNIAQSALSTQIKQLEDHLGVVLINRRKRATVSLTEAGELFLGEARLALQQLDRAERIGRLASRGLIGHVRLAYIASAAVSGLLARALTAFRREHPDVVVHLSPQDTPGQLRALNEGQIDVGLLRPGAEPGPDLKVADLCEDELVIALSAQHPLARSDRIAVRALLGERFIVPHFNDMAGFAEHLRRLGDAAGGAIADPVRVPDFISALSLASAGYGVVLVPRAFANLAMEGVVLKAVSGFTATAQIAIAWRARSMSPAAAALVRTFRAVEQRDPASTAEMG